MRLAVDGLGGLLVGGFGQAEDLACLLVERVAVVGNLVLVLNFLVLPMGIGDRFCGQPFHALVVVHEQWHLFTAPFFTIPRRVLYSRPSVPSVGWRPSVSSPLTGR